MIRIRREDLVAGKMCTGGITWFDRHFPGGKATFKTATDLLLFACANGGARYAEWWMRKSYITHDLSGADLRDANLRCAWLEGVNLRDADLRDANLRCVNLRRADLRHADLTGADLRGADLTGALRHDPDPPIHGWVVEEGKLARRP